MPYGLPASLEDLQPELAKALPDYSFEIKNYLLTKVLLVKSTNFSGAEVRLTKKQLQVSYAVPSPWGRALVANFGLLGVLLARAFTKNALEPRNRVAEYLQTRYEPVKK